MIYRAKPVLSEKLAKQLKSLERKPKHVEFGRLLDAVGFMTSPEKKPRK